MVSAMEADVENLIEVLDGEKQVNGNPSMDDGACLHTQAYATPRYPPTCATAHASLILSVSFFVGSLVPSIQAPPSLPTPPCCCASSLRCSAR